jgi:threonine-phosphate decarboxylase
MLIGHGGNIYKLAETLGCPVSEIIDMSSNVNPLPPLPDLLDHLKNSIHTIKALPEVDAKSITDAFAERYDIDADQVIAGNGTTQFIYAIPQVLSTKRAFIIGPTYSDYADACKIHGARYDYLITEESASFSPDIDVVIERSKEYDTVFICNPNNPTGVLIDIADLHRLCRTHPKVWFVIDESYLPFVNDYVQHSMIRFDLPNVLILNSMSKIFRIPGLRIGFLISSLNIINKFKPFLLPWTVNSLAQAAVETVGENLVDGVISPLFFAAIGGAPMAMAYKMINTLDSMVGYKNAKYKRFGKPSARIDDIANFLPSRLSIVIIAIAAQILNGKGTRSFKIAVTEGANHTSPNAGYPEAGFAGTLRVRLGGPNTYCGCLLSKPFIGASFAEADPDHIKKACDLMMLSSLVCLGILWVILFFLSN